MEAPRSTECPDGALPTGFVSQQQAETLCRMLPLTEAQIAQVSGGLTEAGALKLFQITRICRIRTCMPVIGLTSGLANVATTQAAIGG